LSRIRLRQLLQIVDQPAEQHGLLVQAVHERIIGIDQPVAGGFQVAAQVRQRRTQLVRHIADHVAAQLLLLREAAGHRVEGASQLPQLVLRFHRHTHIEVALRHAARSRSQILDRPQDAARQDERDNDSGQPRGQRTQQHGPVDGLDEGRGRVIWLYQGVDVDRAQDGAPVLNDGARRPPTLLSSLADQGAAAVRNHLACRVCQHDLLAGELAEALDLVRHTAPPVILLVEPRQHIAQPAVIDGGAAFDVALELALRPPRGNKRNHAHRNDDHENGGQQQAHTQAIPHDGPRSDSPARARSRYSGGRACARSCGASS